MKYLLLFLAVTIFNHFLGVSATGAAFSKTQDIYFAGGCFWGVQKFFDQFDGVINTEAGYANGPSKKAPTYSDVCSGSGHAETVRVSYDPGKISLAELINNYFLIIDPLSVNKQGNDRGCQYRTGIYYTDEKLLPELKPFIKLMKRKSAVNLQLNFSR